MRRSLGLALVCAAIVAGAVAGTAFADPSNGGTRTITLYNCSGPPGTPDTFTVVKESGNVVAFHLVDGTATFHPTSLTDVTAGISLGPIPGFNHNGIPIVTCNITRPSDDELFLITGFFTPA